MTEKVKTVIEFYFLLPDFKSRRHPNLIFFSTYGKVLCSWGLAGIAFIFVCFIFFQRQIKNGIEELGWQINRSFGDIHLWYLRRQRKRSGQTEEVGSFENNRDGPKYGL